MAVVEKGGFNKAAESLHITQPTLSRQIAQLEEEVGATLFERTTRKIVLTNEGLLLKRRAEEILSLVERTEKELAEQTDTVEGEIIIGGGQIDAIFDLGNMIREFHEKYPLVKFDFKTCSSDDVIDQMERGLIDIGIVLEPISIDEYAYHKIGNTECSVVLMRADDPLAQKEKIKPEDLLDQPVILPLRQGSKNAIENWFGNYYSDIEVLLTNNLSANNAIFVYQGLGRGICNKSFFELFDESKLIAKPMDPIVETGSIFIWKRDVAMTRALELFISFISAYKA